MKGRRHSWWGKSVKILIALWARSLMTVRVEICRISFGKSLTEHLWKKGSKSVKGERDVFISDSVNPKWWGNPQKHYITDIDIYELFHGKIIFPEKASALPGKSISVYLHLDYIFAKKLFCWRILIYSSTYAISKSMSVSDIQGNYPHLVPACLYQPFFTRRHPRSSTLGKYLWLN